MVQVNDRISLNLLIVDDEDIERGCVAEWFKKPITCRDLSILGEVVVECRRHVLDKNGYTITTRDQALEEIRGGQIDLVVLDLGLHTNAATAIERIINSDRDLFMKRAVLMERLRNDGLVVDDLGGVDVLFELQKDALEGKDIPDVVIYTKHGPSEGETSLFRNFLQKILTVADRETPFVNKIEKTPREKRDELRQYAGVTAIRRCQI